MYGFFSSELIILIFLNKEDIILKLCEKKSLWNIVYQYNRENQIAGWIKFDKLSFASYFSRHFILDILKMFSFFHIHWDSYF